MSNDKTRSQQPAISTTAAAKIGPPSAVPPGRVAPLFRPVDWLTFLITFAFVCIGYYFTLAPALTLEDSGELATGSFTRGFPTLPDTPFGPFTRGFGHCSPLAMWPGESLWAKQLAVHSLPACSVCWSPEGAAC
jgi:hypothetical protein